MFTYKVTCETIEELKLLMASLDSPTERVARELRVADNERRRQNILAKARFRAEAEEIAKRKESVLPRHVSVDKDDHLSLLIVPNALMSYSVSTPPKDAPPIVASPKTIEPSRFELLEID